MSSAVVAEGVRRQYGERVALDGFSLEVPEGSVFGVLGPNGSGKSTFLALVAGAERPPEGSLTILGGPPTRSVRARIGTVFQENASDPLMTPLEYLLFAAGLFGVTGRAARERSADLLERFGLAARANDPISTLSGGMRRRLEVARALLHRPALLLLDEPTTGVDPEERKLLWETVLAERGGATVLLATNDLHEADAVCDLVAFVQAGRVVATGSPAELKRNLRKQTVRVELHSASSEVEARIAELAGADNVAAANGELLLTTDDAPALAAQLLAAVGTAIRGLRIDEASLEDAYFQFVQRRMEAVR
ncbi:ABC transporter ATP-binding protein [Tepidiforma thermophila]|uniref:ABC-2 type transport system ATP-binding protein n=1 Tax=Tepidiforma thermophila (strain KCTC 52669 / CGMCC 1.13589 / G233) TaxID=2761530 RepID=A0A2A9HIT7_TEPT2|nr:ABC transporter ATP-binding protein [Tepidiforma thermophila]PFG75111.1 ABC-2 type transport system ATP-binding protein [Tepidiforma thermophila]